jgi:hypothetical protein
VRYLKRIMRRSEEVRMKILKRIIIHFRLSEKVFKRKRARIVVSWMAWLPRCSPTFSERILCTSCDPRALIRALREDLAVTISKLNRDRT